MSPLNIRELRYTTNSCSVWRAIPIDAVGIVPPNSGTDTAIAVDSQVKVHIGDFRSGSLGYATNRYEGPRHRRIAIFGFSVPPAGRERAKCDFLPRS